MRQSFRMFSLLVVCLVIGFLYWAANIGILLTVDCWKIHDVWLNQHSFVSPFFAFSILFVLLFFWLILEDFLIRRKRSDGVFHTTLLAAVLIFLISVFYVQYEHWQLLDFSQEKITFEEYWENRETKFLPLPEPIDLPEFQSYHDFKYELRCQNGLSRFNLTEQEKEQLRKLYAKKNSWKITR